MKLKGWEHRTRKAFREIDGHQWGEVDLVDYVASELQKQKEAIIQTIKDRLDIVAPLPDPPFRADYIDKWKLIDIIKKIDDGGK